MGPGSPRTGRSAESSPLAAWRTADARTAGSARSSAEASSSGEPSTPITALHATTNNCSDRARSLTSYPARRRMDDDNAFSDMCVLSCSSARAAAYQNRSISARQSLTNRLRRYLPLRIRQLGALLLQPALCSVCLAVQVRSLLRWGVTPNVVNRVEGTRLVLADMPLTFDMADAAVLSLLPRAFRSFSPLLFSCRLLS